MNMHIENSKRDVYFSDKNNNNVGTFSYCRDTRRWTLLEGDNYDACDDNDYVIAYSAKTASFDISSTFLDPWFSASGTPLDLYFAEVNGTINQIRFIESCTLYVPYHSQVP